MSETTTEKIDFWALVELFGHNKIVGKVSEQSVAGANMLRVDVPAFNGAPAFTKFYGNAAIYAIAPITEEIARGLMAQYRAEPVSRFDLPQLAEKVSEPSFQAQEYCPSCRELEENCTCEEEN